MRFHLPKPLHGWRSFVGEVGIIVLGVLIALGASQLAQEWQWRQLVKQSDTAFKMELQTAIWNASVRLATEPCLKQRLSEIEAKLNEPGEDWRGMPEKLNFPPSPTQLDFAAPYHAFLPVPPIATNAWSNALANGTVAHLPYSHATYLSDAYDAAIRFRDNRHQESMTVAKLAPLATDRKLTGDNRIAMLQIVRELSHLDDLIQDESEAILFALKFTEYGYTDASFREQSAPLVAMARSVRGTCVTEHYIQEMPK